MISVSEDVDLLETVFENGVLLRDDSLAEIRARVAEGIK